jgi:PAS domain S-box-containing protein
MFHETLLRQLVKHFGSEDKIPKELYPIFQVISETYKHGDEDRALVERSLEISSGELEEINRQLKSEHEIIEKEVEKRTQELSAERNKLSLILSGILDCVIAVDRQKKIILFNKAAENLSGYTAEEVFGKPLEEIIKFFDNTTEIMSNIYCPIRSDNFEGIIYDKKGLKMLGAKNKTAYVNLLAGQITEGKDVNLGSILTLHDISGEKELDEMKLDFVSMAAHELRTPLTSIKGYIYIFIRDFESILRPDQLKILTRIGVSTQRLASLVENLLNVTRIERGKVTLNLQPVDWIKNIEEVIAEICDQAKDKNIQLDFMIPKEPVLIKADKFRINEVLMNLLANAIAYTPSGGKVTVSVEKVGQEAITHIQDNGEGIPKEALPRLFTKFFRVSGPLEQGSKGTGLGLYIAKSIVEIHKGRIWVQSSFGKGSTFSFSLPLA